MSLTSGCVTSPTGRSQFMMMPDEQINQMGLQSFNTLKQQKKIATNPQFDQFAQCVANAVTQTVGGQWEVVVFADNALNAFALPGNKIGVYTGLIQLVDNQDQLAAVIGHEIGHVLARHGNERASQQFAVNEGMGILQAITHPTTPMGQNAFALLGIGAQYGILMPYSRTQESEADIIGENLMAKAGFNPEQSLSLWQKMEQASQGQQPPEFLSTHPAHATRIQDLQQHMPQAMQFYQQAQQSGKTPDCRK